MSIVQRLREVFAPGLSDLRETYRQERDTNALLVERLAELEFALEDANYMRLAAEGSRDFSRDGLRRISRQARIYWIKNPLILRGVKLKTSFVFGQGLNLQAKDPTVNEVVQAFWMDPANQACLTSQQALIEQEDNLQLEANAFFALFTHPASGRVRVRSLPFDEIEETISDPEDALTVWYYRRDFTRKAFDLASGTHREEPATEYHPDWRYRPAAKPDTIGGKTVRWDAPVYHVAVNRLPGMRWGVSEVYAALDWARSYKEFLENWASIVAAYARFAWQAKTKGGASAVAAVKSRLQVTSNGNGAGADTNPPPATASTFVSNNGVSLEPVRTAGATTSAEDGRRLLLMVCAALGVYEHYLGDPATGNLATAKAMERPMELMFLTRRMLWADVLTAILMYAVEQAALAPGGALSGTLTTNEYGEPVVDLGELDTHIAIEFPPLLDKDTEASVRAIISAATLDGKSPQGLDLKTTTQMLLQVLGRDDVDEMIEQLFPSGWEEDRARKAMEMAQAMAATAQPDEGGTPADKAVAEALRDLREAIGDAA
jgi:hypothetical protein